MSELRDTLAQVVLDRFDTTGEQCVNLTTGAVFYAEIETQSDVVLDAEVGQDIREKIMMHVNRAAADKITAQQIVSVSLYGQATKFRVVKRQDNPASFQVDFEIVKIIPKDQQ